jgi:hypothetical protein
MLAFDSVFPTGDVFFVSKQPVQAGTAARIIDTEDSSPPSGCGSVYSKVIEAGIRRR